MINKWKTEGGNGAYNSNNIYSVAVQTKKMMGIRCNLFENNLEKIDKFVRYINICYNNILKKFFRLK